MSTFPYTTISEFHRETFSLSKHLNIPLNKLRKGIAARYGFNGIKPFEDYILKRSLSGDETLPIYVINKGVEVFVVLFNALHYGSAGFDWYYNEVDALNAFENDRKHVINNFPEDNQVVLVKVEVSSYDNATDEIESVQDDIFDNHDGYRYPLAKNVWKDLIRHQDNDLTSSLKEFVCGVDVNNHLTDENGVLNSGDGAVRVSGMISLGLDDGTKTPVIYVTFPRGFKDDGTVLSIKIKFNTMEAFNTAKLVDYRLKSEALFTPSEKSFIIWDNIIKALTS
jgi:hypothetical protein